MEINLNEAADKVLAHLNTASDYKANMMLSKAHLTKLGIANIDVADIYNKLTDDHLIVKEESVREGLYVTKLTALGREFVRSGGYVNEYETKKAEYNHSAKINELTLENLKLDIEIKKYQARSAPIELLKNYWWLGGVLISLGYLVRLVVDKLLK
jgi:hypothetical protein